MGGCRRQNATTFWIRTLFGALRVSFEMLCRIDTVNEIAYFKAGGILHHVLREMLD